MQSGPGFVPTFLYYFVSTTLIVAFVVSQGLTNAESLATWASPLQIGLLFGLLGGSLGAYFNRYEAIELPLKNRGSDLKRLNQSLEKLGYIESREIDQVTVYERPFPSSIFAGKLLISINQQTVTISGRASRLNALSKLIENLKSSL
ncbi:MAG: hypothetical protein NW220_22000 [Leptolyngbyaceae cyanobacterium bins.349]|nr:hypothetical protein [Leptolyngbyaceae cyanobacterium bins.349]